MRNGQAEVMDEESPIDESSGLDRLEPQAIERAPVTAIAALNRSDVEAQLDAAHQHPRSVKRFLMEAQTLATMNREIAEACIYSVPRGGKQIVGPSVRLAEICASAYGNMHVGARVMDAEDKQIAAQGVAWDLEKNLRVTMEVRRSIVNKSGRRFNDDMINTTGNAAASIAFRNAVFRVIPRAYVNEVYNKARQVAVGDAKTLGTRRQEIVERINKLGITTDRILARLGKASVEDIGLDDLETLIGIGTAIKNGDAKLDEAFPPVAVTVAPGAEGQRISMRKPEEKKAEASPAPVDAGKVTAPADAPAEKRAVEAEEPRGGAAWLTAVNAAEGPGELAVLDKATEDAAGKTISAEWRTRLKKRIGERLKEMQGGQS